MGIALIFALLGGYIALLVSRRTAALGRGGLQMTAETEPALKAELYKSAYELAAQRYENLYNAVWTNFSYMSVIAAGILSFAADKLYFPALFLVAFAPLVFWHRVTYKPLDRYGENALENLVEMESRISSEFGLKIDHYTHFKAYRKANPKKRVASSISRIMNVMLVIWIAVGAFCGWKLYVGHSLTKGGDDKTTISLPDGPMRIDISRRP